MSDIYLDPQLARWLGSMEGVPEWPEPVEAPVERASRTTLQNRLHQVVMRKYHHFAYYRAYPVAIPLF